MDYWPKVDWSMCPAVESRPGVCGGKWVFAGTRVPVYALFANLASGGMTADHFSDAFLVDNEKVKEILAFLGTQLDQTAPKAEHTEREPGALEELLTGLTRENFHEEIGFGPPAGREFL